MQYKQNKYYDCILKPPLVKKFINNKMVLHAVISCEFINFLLYFAKMSYIIANVNYSEYLGLTDISSITFRTKRAKHLVDNDAKI